ncbi:MAG: hypothetical protein EOO61_02795 [Hymenobacter sp.]|nr:MAG: hypothetical protein EOO61_02795 [Hymenobacter sp.]
MKVYEKYMGKKITYEREIVDKETGESIKTYSEAILPKEPDFIKLYLESITKLNDIQGWTDPILHELLKLMNYRNDIVLNAAIKKRMSAELGISTRTIDNALSMLVKKDIIFREDTGLYKGNPYLFGKGEWRDIRELRMKVVFNPQGQTISTEVRKGDGEPQSDKVENLEELVLQ